jgi:hypothetical protein
MAMQRLSRLQKRILGWLAADAQRTKGVIVRGHEDLGKALPGDQGNLSRSLHTPAAQGDRDWAFTWGEGAPSAPHA